MGVLQYGDPASDERRVHDAEEKVDGATVPLWAVRINVLVPAREHAGANPGDAEVGERRNLANEEQL